jgi:hypothetical protein
LAVWLTARREAIDVLAAARAGMGEIDDRVVHGSLVDPSLTPTSSG